MIDSNVRELLENVIDSPVKLQLVLLFDENPQLKSTVKQVANRIYRDIWSTREALQELQHDGVLATIGETDPIYCYAPQADLTRQIKLLAQSYNEPIERDTIQNMMRSIAKDASFRRARRQICGAYELQMI